MKRILSLLCIGSVVFALNALAAPDAAKQKGKGKKGSAASAQVAASAKGKGAAIRSDGRAQVRAAPARSHEFTRSSRGIVRRSEARTRQEAGVVRERGARERFRSDQGVTATRTSQYRATRERVAPQRQVVTTRERGFRRGTAWQTARNRDVQIVNTWRSSQFSGRAYAPFRDYRRAYHDRGWYRSHYGSSVVFVLGGWWYWNSGYWYPAWGYAPYTYYPYDGPIYTGYASLTPDRVVVEVQQQLARDGYYPGPIDGSLGPMTRRALAAFQADNGLAVTSAIDRPTLSTLGIS